MDIRYMWSAIDSVRMRVWKGGLTLSQPLRGVDFRSSIVWRKGRGEVGFFGGMGVGRSDRAWETDHGAEFGVVVEVAFGD